MNARVNVKANKKNATQLVVLSLALLGVLVMMARGALKVVATRQQEASETVRKVIARLAEQENN